MSQTLATQSLVLGLEASLFPGSLWEMQILRIHLSPTWFRISISTRSQADSYAQKRLKSSELPPLAIRPASPPRHSCYGVEDGPQKGWVLVHGQNSVLPREHEWGSGSALNNSARCDAGRVLGAQEIFAQYSNGLCQTKQSQTLVNVLRTDLKQDVFLQKGRGPEWTELQNSDLYRDDGAFF